jgi:hypothetical protein
VGQHRLHGLSEWKGTGLAHLASALKDKTDTVILESFDILFVVP